MIEWLITNKQWFFSGIGVLFISGLFKAFHYLSKHKKVNQGLTVFKGSHVWSGRQKEYIIKIYYPEPYDYTPNLNLDFPKKEDEHLITTRDGIWKNYDNNIPKPVYNIYEQRPDGFVVAVTSLGYYKPYFNWKATGKINRKAD